MKEQMPNQTNQLERDGWNDETQKRRSSVGEFLKGHLEGFSERPRRRERKRYSSDELHFSGGDTKIMQRVKEGEAPDKVEVLRQKGRITQIHVIFFNDKGLNLDVYFTEKALTDYLEKYGDQS